MTQALSALDIVLAYHQRTKHRFDGYAPGPDTLDWDDQPAPFRHFAGTAEIVLPGLCRTGDGVRAALEQPFDCLHQTSAQACDLTSLGALLQLSLAVNAWKTYGPSRWAVRVNPSSGNLHPVEAYVRVRHWPGLADGLYHYRPDDHVLELRGEPPETADASPDSSTPSLELALTSVMWREAWKYGERAFRYCQLDTGHAVAAVAYAAAVLGWQARRRPLASDDLAALLGLDRSQDFPRSRNQTGREEPELLLQIDTAAACPSPDATPPSLWHGQASVIDNHPFYHWPIIDDVALASRLPVAAVTADPTPSADAVPTPRPGCPSAYRVINGRRSAQRFDARFELDRDAFIALLRHLRPNAGAPWSALTPEQDGVNLLLFIHRVAGFAPGIYLLPQTHGTAGRLQQALSRRFALTPVLDTELPPLLLLETGEASALKRLSRALHCHQDIAANACFALGMVAEFAPRLAGRPWAYRDLLRQAGLIGQVLYLQAEAHGVRGTGIGCFFDDPLHELLELDPIHAEFQTLYHFTVGQPMDDPRIESTPPRFPGDDLP